MLGKQDNDGRQGRPRRASAPHWSVDFVEHLRAVHFILVTWSVALIVIMSGTHESTVSRALTQATEIAQFEEHWNEKRGLLYRLNARRSIASEVHQMLIRISNSYLVLDPNVDPVPGTTRIGLDISADEYWRYRPWQFGGTAMDNSPHSLSEFSAWWNRLRAGALRLSVPNIAKITHCLVKNFVVVSDQASQAVRYAIAKTNLMLASITCDVIPGWLLESDTKISGKFLDPDPAIPGDGNPFLILAHRPLTFRLNNGTEIQREANIAVEVPIFPITLTESSLKVIFPDWRTGPYEIAFNELASLSYDFTNIPLRDVVVRISALQTKAEENIEAFGLKIPVVQTKEWGVIVLLVIQLYFWLHLHEFKRKIAPSSPGLDVAWLGVYRSQFAVVATSVSSCILPIAAVITAVSHVSSEAPMPLATKLEVCALGVCCVLASSTADRLMRLRETLSDVSDGA